MIELQKTDHEKEPNTECIICGKKYYVCNNCKKMKQSLSWREIADNITCYKIFMIIKQYLDGDIQKEAAKNMLKNINIEDIGIYENWVQFQIKRIME